MLSFTTVTGLYRFSLPYTLARVVNESSFEFQRIRVPQLGREEHSEIRIQEIVREKEKEQTSE